MPGEREANLVANYPWVKWDEPARIAVAGAPTKLCCKFCVAIHGLNARDVDTKGFATLHDWKLHMIAEHQRGKIA